METSTVRELPNTPFMNDGKKPRCQERVVRYIGNWSTGGQCYRSAAIGDRCKQHDPERVKKKTLERNAIADQKWQHRRKEIHGARFYNALKQIANGHNNPRTLAQGVVNKFEEGARHGAGAGNLET